MRPLLDVRAMAFLLVVLAACGGCDEASSTAGGGGGGGVGTGGGGGATCGMALRDVPFGGEELVTIEGYDGDAMEVDISPDGEILMFNDLVEGGPPHKNMHWASRVSDTHFQYQGQVDELNTDGVDGTPSFDAEGRIYFTSTGDYATNGFKTIFLATQVGGVWQPTLVEGLYGGAVGLISLDPDIAPSGRFLLYSFMTDLDPATLPDQMEVRGMTVAQDGTMTPIGSQIFDEVNDPDLLVYAPTISGDGLEMYFTRADTSIPAILGIYRAARGSTDQPFVAGADTVAAITGEVEAPSFNADETALYYHRRESPSEPYRIYRVTRALPAGCR